LLVIAEYSATILTTEQVASSGEAPPVLVVAHPGHELRVYGWMTAARPVVHVLTDGSGSTGASRLASTTAVLDRVGATRGCIYGAMTDREIYGAIISGDHPRFTALAEQLGAALVRDDVTVIAGDAVEGFNPSHDVCRYIINAAVRIAGAAGRQIACYAFPLDGPPGGTPPARHGRAIRVELDDRTLDGKLEAAHNYAELRSEVDSALVRFGREPFRLECLSPVDLDDPYGWNGDHVPYYETYGAQRVATGTYERVVTFREHVKPLADALYRSHRAVSA
jgi:hypothetical protein